jgi:hypothetical protein
MLSNPITLAIDRLPKAHAATPPNTEVVLQHELKVVNAEP